VGWRVIYMIYCRNWQALADFEKEEIRDFFEEDHTGAWNWRRFDEQPDGSVTLEAEFTDVTAALLFKLRWGSK
jgi:hypothetical protein